MIIFKHTIKNCRLKSSIIKSFDHIPQIEFIGHASTTILNKNFDERVAYITRFHISNNHRYSGNGSYFLNNIEKYVNENFGVKNIEFIFQDHRLDLTGDFLLKNNYEKNIDNDFYDYLNLEKDVWKINHFTKKL